MAGQSPGDASPFTIRTARLTLTPVAPEDSTRLHDVFIQPGVRRHIFDDVVIPLAQTREIIDRSLALFAEHGFGLRLACRTDDGALVGFGGLWFFRDPPELELLYGVADARVKQGYGREIARATVDDARTRLHMTVLRASTDRTHVESRRLLEALGFRLEREATIDGLETAFYVRHG